MNLKAELNEEQIKAVEQTEGPVMVIAGAGSGKTRVLTYRIAHLIEKGVDPFNILTLTFTNKAAREMRERIESLVGSESRNIWMGTFHSIFARILRNEHETIQYERNFTIYDTQDSRNLIKTILQEKNLDDKIYKPSIVHNRISAAKNNLISPKAYLSNSTVISEDAQSGKPLIGELYKEYNIRCRRASAMDFDDLLYKTCFLLKDHGDILRKYQHLFRFILVDEYQDTNFAQYVIIKQLAALNENICVVGDDAQSIYGFRGANIQNILNFQKDYPDALLFKLERNYRSTQNIVNAANSIIKLNKDQIEKEVWTSNDKGSLIHVHQSHSDGEEGRYIANMIFEKKMNYRLSNDQFAILYRTNAQSRAMEEALRKKDIPYRIYGGLSFYQRKEIKDLIAYLRLTINPSDEEAIKRVINYPARGIGKTSLEKIIVKAGQLEKSIWEVISDPHILSSTLGGAVLNKIQAFVVMIQSFQTQLTKKNAYELASEMATSTGLLKLLFTDRTPEGISRYENIQELLNAIKEFSDKELETPDGNPSLASFLEDVALLTDADNENPDDSNKVSLMTIHLAKGLEFPYVFLVGLEENLFPSQLSMSSRAELEEERRLFYVAVTRAKADLTLSYSTSRYRWGNLIYCEPSRFIEEIDPSFLDGTVDSLRTDKFKYEQESPTSFTRPTKNTTTSPLPRPMKKNLVNVQKASSSPAKFTPVKVQKGSTVKHARFGIGEVTAVEGNEPDVKATVQFKTAGTKQLLLKFARLEVVTF